MQTGTLARAELACMAEKFFGYGRWSAPFWFIGPEPGMAQDGDDDLLSRYESWKKLNFRPVVDCAAHHRGFGFLKWHQPHPPTQPTWRQLIRLLLTYQGKPNDIEAIRAYQRDHWGSETGETCVIELSALASPNIGTAQDRTSFVESRINRIKQEIQRNRPELLVMYGVGRRREWMKIRGEALHADNIFCIGTTVGAIARHPVTTGLGNNYWEALGIALREFGKSI